MAQHLADHMYLQENQSGTIISIFVKPNQRQFGIKDQDDALLVLCREKPVKGRVNRELIKQFSKLFKTKVKILSGLTSTRKRLLIVSAHSKEVERILSTSGFNT